MQCCHDSSCLEPVALSKHVEVVELRPGKPVTGTCEILIGEEMRKLDFREVSNLFDFFFLDSEDFRIELTPVSFRPSCCVELHAALEFVTIPPAEHSWEGKMIRGDIPVEYSVIVAGRNVFGDDEKFIKFIHSEEDRELVLDLKLVD